MRRLRVLVGTGILVAGTIFIAWIFLEVAHRVAEVALF